MSDLINQRYHVQRELGQGGMSVVYLAFDERLKREVALKVLHPHLATREESRRRFLQEATAIARLEHPHILKIYDYASPEEERSYIVSQPIRGETLKAWASRLPSLPSEVVMLVCQPIFAALAHAHEHKIIHRDVKPENIMIQREDGAPVLMDFGIAHLIDAETLTATGAVIGSPAHMAPEVVNGEELTASADLFSMGTVMYWLCCGALPFVAPHPAALFKRILETRFDPVLERRPETFAPLARLIERCMRRAPSDRPESARVVAEQLSAYLAELGLKDIKRELASLSHDSALYLEALPQRLCPAYLESAQALSERGDNAAALERLSRLLSLDAQHTQALELQERLLNTPSPWPRRSALTFSLLGALLMTLTSVWTSPPQDHSNELNTQPNAQPNAQPKREASQDKRATLTNELKTARPNELSSERASSTAPLDPASAPSVLTTPLTTDLPPPTQAPKALKSDTQDEGGTQLKPRQKRALKRALTPRLKSRLRAGFKRDQKKPPRLTSTLRRAQKTPKVNKLIKAQPSSSAAYQLIAIRSRYKGAAVFVNQERLGRVFEVERSEGVRLSLNAKHIIEFRSPYCEDQREELTLPSQARPPIKLVFECRFKPASFKVKAPEGAEIYLRGERPLRLGVANQEISYKMTQATQRLSLLVVSPTTQERPVMIKLTAGKHSEVSAL